MSRTNPYKKKRRSANKTILIYGEGLNEDIFLKYLHGLYSRDINAELRIRRGKGGTADRLVVQAHKIQGAFDIRIVVLDNDKGCLEAILLSILCDGKDFKNRNSNWCKKEFELKYIDKKNRAEINEYIKLFPRKLLEKQRDRVFELNKLISIMEGKNLE